MIINLTLNEASFEGTFDNADSTIEFYNYDNKLLIIRVLSSRDIPSTITMPSETTSFGNSEQNYYICVSNRNTFYSDNCTEALSSLPHGPMSYFFIDATQQKLDIVYSNQIIKETIYIDNFLKIDKYPPCASYGDLDDDGYVTYADRDLMLLHSVGDGDFTDEQVSRADLDGNGQSGDAVDVNLIAQFVAGDVSIFPVCTSGLPGDRTSGPSGPIVIPRSPDPDVAHEDGGVQCSIDEPCEQGLECIRFPKVGLICAEPDPCSYYECPSGTSCMVAESYPAQVMCQCRGPDCSIDSGSTNTVAYDAQTKTVVVGVNGINVRQREVTMSRTTSQNEGLGIVSKPKGVLKSGTVSAEYSGDLMFEESRLYMTTSAGKREINIMPEDVVGIPEMPDMESVEIELREDSGRPAYFVNGANQRRLFFVLPVVIDVEAKVDAETGKLVSVDKPWWSFLAW